MVSGHGGWSVEKIYMFNMRKSVAILAFVLSARSSSALTNVVVSCRVDDMSSCTAAHIESAEEPLLPLGVPEEVYGTGSAAAYDDVIAIAAPSSLHPDDLYYEDSLMLTRPLLIFADWLHKRGGLRAGGKRYGVRFSWVGDGSSAVQVANATARAMRNARARFAFSGYSSGLTWFAAQQSAADGLLMLSAGSAATTVFAQNNLTFGLYPPASMYTASGLEAIAAAARALDARADVRIAHSSSLLPCFGGVGCLASLRAGFVQVDNLFTRDQCAASPAWARRHGISSVSLPPVTLRMVPSVEEATTLLQQLRSAGATVLVGCTYHAAAVVIIAALERMNWSPNAVLLSETIDKASFISRVAAGWWQGEYVLGPTQWTSSLPTTGTFSRLSSSEFADMFRARFDGAEVSYNGAAQFAAACALGAAIEAADSVETAAVRAQLERLTLDEFYGRIAFGAEHQISSAGLLVVQHPPGEPLKVVHSPTGLPTTGELLFPSPPWAQRRCRVLGPAANASASGQRSAGSPECSGHGSCSLEGACLCDAGYGGIACARSLLQACGTGHEPDPDPFATEHCRACRHGTWKSEASFEPCEPCPARSSTMLLGATARSKCECFVGFYAEPLPSSSADAFHCRVCTGFQCPSAGTTLATISLGPGTWRSSARTTSIVSCRGGANGTSPCLGGVSAERGYCAGGHSGTRCEVCDPGDYFSEHLAACTACPAARLTTSALGWLSLIGMAMVLSYFILYPSLVRLLPTEQAITFASATVALYRRPYAVYKAFDLKIKFKIGFSFYQAAVIFPSAYQVVLPERYTQTMSVFSWTKLDGLTLLLLTACYPARLASRLLREALLPLALLAAVLLCGYLRGRMQRLSAPLTIGLPVALWLSFVLVPVVSAAIFRAWDCTAFPYDDAADAVQFQLRADLAVRCSDPTYRSDAHEEVVRQATALLLLWPIGFPTLFTLLLLRCRGDILNGRSTPLSRATTFLLTRTTKRSFSFGSRSRWCAG